VSEPIRTIAPPIQIHAIIGETTIRNCAGGGSLRYAATRAPTTTAWTSVGERPNFRFATVIGFVRREMSGWTALQTSRPRPQRTSTSLVDSPMKKRPNGPPVPSVAA
jgi:hypothetical protein